MYTHLVHWYPTVTADALAEIAHKYAVLPVTSAKQSGGGSGAKPKAYGSQTCVASCVARLRNERTRVANPLAYHRAQPLVAYCGMLPTNMSFLVLITYNVPRRRVPRTVYRYQRKLHNIPARITQSNPMAVRQVLYLQNVGGLSMGPFVFFTFESANKFTVSQPVFAYTKICWLVAIIFLC